MAAGRTARPQIVQNNVRRFRIAAQLTNQLIQHQTQKTRCPQQRPFQGIAVDDGVAQQGKAAHFHAVAVHAKKLIVGGLGNPMPEFGVMA